jgi:hypothetical protein
MMKNPVIIAMTTHTYKQWLSHRHNGEWRNGLNEALNK